ncbi:hypothetical protein AB0M43_03395 [Longispora sp. NPDC051575]|uniref:hypothetical protein n=1 Tax=Longispora sp. NPDC051575 TaxID=3154943 RepID=UPI0034448755
MSRLERRYRGLLRLLPAPYRRAWEEDMVTAFLESMATGDPELDEDIADLGRPPASEVLSVLALAARLWFGGLGAPPRQFVWGQALRIAALVGLLSHAASVVSSLVVRLWIDGRLGLIPFGPPGVPAEGIPVPGVEVSLPPALWDQVWIVVDLLVLAGYLALLLGRRRLSQVLVVLAILPAPLWQGLYDSELLLRNAPRFVLDLLLVLAMGAFRSDSPKPRLWPWLLAVPVGGLVLAAPLILVLGLAVDPFSWSFDTATVYGALLTVAIAGYLVAGALRPARDSAWGLALLVLGGAVLALRLGTWGTAPGSGSWGELLVVAALLAVGLPLALRTRRALRGLPQEA